MTSTDARITSLADAIATNARVQGATAPEVRGSDWHIAVVTAVSTSGTVDVGTIRARRVASYTNPAVGDLIALSRSGSGSWIALGRMATTADDYQDYTPTFGTSGGGASLGNGSIAGRYLRTGRRVDFELVCTFGSTTNYGTGSFNFSLPATAATRGTAGVAPVRATRATGNLSYVGAGQIGSNATTVAFIVLSAGTAAASATQPFTWATNDLIRISGTYEAA